MKSHNLIYKNLNVQIIGKNTTNFDFQMYQKLTSMVQNQYELINLD